MNARSEGGASDSSSLRILDDYDFDLPTENVSQRPAPRRESARLMVLDRSTGEVVECGAAHRVDALPDWLRSGDLLVVNVTRVLPARLVGRKSSGGSAEALLVERTPGAAGNRYRALVKCRGRLRSGLTFEFVAAGDGSKALGATLVDLHDRGEVTLEFAADADPYAIGRAPLPPYIRRADAANLEDEAGDSGSSKGAEAATDLDRYQTVYAREPGAIAAPTAGLHLTQALLERLRVMGVEIAEVVLHVGAGTFRPLDEAAFSSGRLHAERFDLPEETVAAVARTRSRRGRIVAVGTTTTRVLEACANEAGELTPGKGETDLFLRPGAAPFRVIDALLTNFHLPRSSLLLLVAAFVGREPLLSAYRRAIEEGFRFYSYGDAMLIVSGTQAPRSGSVDG
jgi:S-adenosylmethionine:tRNA ribosyltransferase-isomerase